ncbi:MAG: hypothetical protein JXB13_10650 [Phycisphaerae bacterium]|nr:hypothetical protein [Phycisphaerae bacterium]
MRQMIALALPLILALAGCQTTRSHALSLPSCPRDTGYSNTLLFNRDVTLPPASQYAQRSVWPGILSPTSPGETVLVRERFIDWQGPGARGRDFTYRRFDAYRVGYERR